MDVQELLNRNAFLEDEVHRCYAEIEDYEVKTKEFKTEIAKLEKLLNRQCVIIADYDEMFDKIVERLEKKRD
ncbi:hypothetical protein [uncultured Streptococcus sp.]|uniref:hypothetical protein n=1 Tax=uncultured Streptococcus sp. TaxID=83427 RepID=UPI0025996B4C|nr:hypothetical protein [uncultured Streptococcus sp.]